MSNKANESGRGHTVVGSGGPRPKRKRERSISKGIDSDDCRCVMDQEVAASNHRVRAPPRTLPPMAPARRTTLRRSRRLNAKQSSHEEELTNIAGGNEESDISCDEDLEGTVVDLSFEVDTDDAHVGWESGSSRRSQCNVRGDVGNLSKVLRVGGEVLIEDKCRKWNTGDGVMASSDGNNCVDGTEALYKITNGTAHAMAPSDPRLRNSERKPESSTSEGLAGVSASGCIKTKTGPVSIENASNRSKSRTGVGLRLPVPSPPPSPPRIIPQGVQDIDATIKSESDPHLLNAEYSWEQAANLRTQERVNRPKPYIFVGQDIKPSVRSVLIDWIVEVCDQFHMSSRALFQVVELIDRSLSTLDIPRSKLQLLGCACVILAAKFEEIYAPTAEELAHISDNTYTRAEIIKMELEVARALSFRLSCVTPRCFFDRFCRAAGSNKREKSLVSYLLEILLLDYQAVQLLPSLKAAAALYLARQTLCPSSNSSGRGKGSTWTTQTEFYTGYSAKDLEACVRRLHTLHLRSEGGNLKAVREKYTRACHHRVADVTCIIPEALEFGEE